MHHSRYHLLGQVGQGQFGRVFCAIDRARGILVALKDLEFSRYPTNKFLREITYLVSLQHPNIVSFQGFEHHKSSRYLVLDYCNGGTLRDLLESGAIADLRQGLQLIVETLDALGHAHDRGIVHCDIKPENILLNFSGKGCRAKISDFGISRLMSEAENRRQSGGYTGSPAYMAPERFYGKYSPASDLYAVGIILFELITGKRPFSGLPGELMSAHLSQAVQIPDTIPESLRSIVEISLRKLPQRRFETAGEMRRYLLEAMAYLPEKSRFSDHPHVLCTGKIDRENSIDSHEDERWRKVAEKFAPNEIFPLDRRYGIAVFHSNRFTRLAIVNRRGSLYRGVTLPFILHNLTTHPHLPDRFFGIQREPDRHAVLIGLKPFRVSRLPLDLVPDSVSCLDRGYRLANSESCIEIGVSSEFSLVRSTSDSVVFT